MHNLTVLPCRVSQIDFAFWRTSYIFAFILSYFHMFLSNDDKFINENPKANALNTHVKFKILVANIYLIVVCV